MYICFFLQLKSQWRIWANRPGFAMPLLTSKLKQIKKNKKIQIPKVLPKRQKRTENVIPCYFQSSFKSQAYFLKLIYITCQVKCTHSKGDVVGTWALSLTPAGTTMSFKEKCYAYVRKLWICMGHNIPHFKMLYYNSKTVLQFS